MKRLHPRLLNFVMNIYGLGKSLEMGMRVVDGNIFTPDEMKSWAVSFREVGLNVSASLLDEMVRYAGSEYGRKQRDTVPELARQLRRELESIYLTVVPNDKIALIRENQQSALNATVASKFGQDVADELQEAGRALAFGLNTACVFHLVRVVEAGLRALAANIGSRKSKHLPTWDAVFKEIDGRLEKLRLTKRYLVLVG
jgi:hypothetical protein